MRPSRSVFDAADAAFLEVTFFGAFRCESALPAEDFDARPVDFPRNVLEALLAAGFLVVLLFAILHLLFVQLHHQLLLRGPAHRACWARQHTHLRDSGIRIRELLSHLPVANESREDAVVLALVTDASSDDSGGDP